MLPNETLLLIIRDITERRVLEKESWRSAGARSGGSAGLYDLLAQQWPE